MANIDLTKPLLLNVPEAVGVDGWYTTLQSNLDAINTEASSGFQAPDDTSFRWGDSDDYQIQHNTVQTNDHLVFGTSGANLVLLTSVSQFSNDFGYSTSTNPKLIIQDGSAVAIASVSILHDGNDAIIETGTGFLSIGPKSSSHALGTGLGDLFVRSDLEVDGNLWADGNIHQTSGLGSSLINFIEDGASGRGQFRVQYDQESFIIAVNSDLGRQFVFTDYDNVATDHNHTPQTNPTVFIHSATSPSTDDTQWISFAHNQTDGVISTGAGSLVLNPASETIIGDAGSTSHSLGADGLFVTGQLEVDGFSYFDNQVYMASILVFGPTHSAGMIDGLVQASGNPTLVMAGASNDPQIVLTARDHVFAGRDFDHAAPTDPTLFIHSATDPNTANDEWISFAHNQTDGVIDLGKGEYDFAGGTGVTVETVTHDETWTVKIGGVTKKIMLGS